MYKKINRFMNKRVSQGQKPDAPTTSNGPVRTASSSKGKKKGRKLGAHLDAAVRRSLDGQWRAYEKECKRLGIPLVPRR